MVLLHFCKFTLSIPTNPPTLQSESHIQKLPQAGETLLIEIQLLNFTGIFPDRGGTLSWVTQAVGTEPRLELTSLISQLTDDLVS